MSSDELNRAEKRIKQLEALLNNQRIKLYDIRKLYYRAAKERDHWKRLYDELRLKD